MWSNIFKIKKIFSKMYKNKSNVYESIYYDIGPVLSPITLVGANGIGGGRYGSFINIVGSVTNNNILDISSNSKDEKIVNIFNIKEQENNDRQIDRVFTHNILDCNILFIDFTYAFQEMSMYPDSREGGYVEVFSNGKKIYSSYGVTTFNGPSSFSDGDGQHKKAVGMGDPGFSYCVFTKSIEFNTKSSVSVNFYIYRKSLPTAWMYEYTLSALKTEGDNITRDIYATVIEQVDPTTIN